MKAITCYIHFGGNCRQAMTFYQECLGGDLQFNTYPDSKGQPSTDAGARIMHSQLSVRGTSILMASDEQPGIALTTGNNFSVSVDCESLEEIERLFPAMSRNGKVRLPLTDVPWGARFGMLTDQFGIQWMFNCYLPKS